MNKTAVFVLKMVAAGLALAACVCLVIGFWDEISAAVKRIGGKSEYDDYADEDLYT